MYTMYIHFFFKYRCLPWRAMLVSNIVALSLQRFICLSGFMYLSSSLLSFCLSRDILWRKVTSIKGKVSNFCITCWLIFRDVSHSYIVDCVLYIYVGWLSKKGRNCSLPRLDFPFFITTMSKLLSHTAVVCTRWQTQAGTTCCRVKIKSLMEVPVKIKQEKQQAQNVLT